MKNVNLEGIEDFKQMYSYRNVFNLTVFYLN